MPTNAGSKSKKSNTEAEAKKPVLRGLPEEEQARIFAHCARFTREKTMAWLKKEKFEVTFKELDGWFFCRQLRETLLHFGEIVTLIKEALQAAAPGLKRKEIERAGDALFNALAITEKDVKLWALAQGIQLKRDDHALKKKMVSNHIKKLELELERFRHGQEEAKELFNDEELTFEEKKARMKEVLGIA